MTGITSPKPPGGPPSPGFEPYADTERMTDDEWQASRWWRVIAPDGSLWCETSNEQEARSRMREGDTLERLYTRTENRWVHVALNDGRIGD